MSKITMKVTNRNIKKRFDREVEDDPTFTLEKMGDLFKTHKDVVWAWTANMKKKSSRLPNSKKVCAHCGKTQYQIVHEWINNKGIL